MAGLRRALAWAVVAAGGIAAAAPPQERVHVALVARPPTDWRTKGVARSTLVHLCHIKGVYRTHVAVTQRVVPWQRGAPLREVSEAGKRLRAQFVVVVELTAATEALAELVYVEDPERCVAATRQRVRARAPLHRLAGQLALELAPAMGLALSPPERWQLSRPLVSTQQACESVWKGDHERDPAKRLELYQLALEQGPRSPLLHNLIGTALARLGHLDRALAAFDRAIQLRPGYAPAHVNRGHVLRELKRWQEAQAAFRRALALGARSAGPYIGMAKLCDRVGAFVEASEWLEKALEIDPANLNVLLTLADTYGERQNHSEALRVANRVLELDRQNVKALNLRGLFLLPREPLRAEMTFRKAVKLHPKDARSRANLALALFAQKRVQEATEALKKAMELAPDDGKPHHFMGLIHMSRKDYEKAAQQFQLAVELDPKFTPARRNLAEARALRRQRGCGCGGTHPLARADGLASTLVLAVLLLGPHAARLTRRRARRKPRPHTARRS